MTIREYRFDDLGAPQLTGEAASVAAVLKACLVTGYGSGEDAKPGAGWTNPFSGANVEVFRNGAGSSQTYFKVVDDASQAAGAMEAYVLMFSAMTDINTGSNQSPATVTGNIFLRKSATADATVRQWRVIASEKWCYLLVATLDSGNNPNIQGFGDYQQFESIFSGSAACVWGRPGNTAGALDTNSSHNNTPGYYVAISYYSQGYLLNNGLAYGQGFNVYPGAIMDHSNNAPSVCAVAGYARRATSGGIASGAIGSNGAMRTKVAVLLPVFVVNGGGSAANTAYLGRLPGLFDPATYLGNDAANLEFSGEYAGRSFQLVRLQGTLTAAFLIETTAGAW